MTIDLKGTASLDVIMLEMDTTPTMSRCMTTV